MERNHNLAHSSLKAVVVFVVEGRALARCYIVFNKESLWRLSV